VLRQLLARHTLRPGSLELEITEGVLMSATDSLNEIFAVVSELDIRIAMDDFGTGYSSLSYLRRYPFDVIKIDRTFVRDVTTDDADRELVVATIAMAQALNLQVVAEGVETQEQFDFLAAQGCDSVQGYFFSRPISADEMTDLLHKSS
jgi:EAL domain-containing protein (putative c-di-GMP-specific phosphodiesterase class I)